MPRRLTVFGSTGSIGRSTLDVLRNCPGLDIEVHALTCEKNWQELLRQTAEFRPAKVVISSPEAAEAFSGALGDDAPAVETGPEALAELARDPSSDIAVMALVGVSALIPTIECLKAGKTVALANKECLVTAGHIVMEAEARHAGKIIPVDSEHSAAFQLLKGMDRLSVKRLIITGSGGALRDVPIEALPGVSPEEALDHPNWDMGPKVTIDSATSMNKALELVEAHWLFGLPAEALAVWIHPQSRVHAAVELEDGGLLFHASPADMRLPIQAALTHPGHVPGPVRPLSLEEISSLSFHEPDPARMPALALAYRVIREGGLLGAVMSAADEVAVKAFLKREIPFTGIVPLVEKVMERFPSRNVPGNAPSLERILQADSWAREEALRLLPEVS